MDHLVLKRFLHPCRTDKKDWDAKTELAQEKTGYVENKDKVDPDMGWNFAFCLRAHLFDLMLCVQIWIVFFCICEWQTDSKSSWTHYILPSNIPEKLCLDNFITGA